MNDMMEEGLLTILEKQNLQTAANLQAIATDYIYDDAVKTAVIQNLRASQAVALRTLKLLHCSGTRAVKLLVMEALTEIQANEGIQWTMTEMEHIARHGLGTDWGDLHAQHDLDVETIKTAGLDFEPAFPDPDIHAENAVSLECMVRANYYLANKVAEAIRRT